MHKPAVHLARKLRSGRKSEVGRPARGDHGHSRGSRDRARQPTGQGLHEQWSRRFSDDLCCRLAEDPHQDRDNRPGRSWVGPDSIVYDEASRRVVTFNGRSNDASVIDEVADRPVAAGGGLAGKPESAVADGRSTIYVDLEDWNELSAIDSAKGNVFANWPLPGCKEPAALAVDSATRRLFVGCHNRTMLILDADNGRVVAAVPIREGVDAGHIRQGNEADLQCAGRRQPDHHQGSIRRPIQRAAECRDAMRCSDLGAQSSGSPHLPRQCGIRRNRRATKTAAPAANHEARYFHAARGR